MKKEDRKKKGKREKGKKGKREKGKKGKREKGRKRERKARRAPRTCLRHAVSALRFGEGSIVRLSFLFRGCRFRGFAGRSRLALRRSRESESGGRGWHPHRSPTSLFGQPNSF